MVTSHDEVGCGDGAVAVGSARELVDGLVSSGSLDSLFERIDRGDVEPAGDGGLIPELVRAHRVHAHPAPARVLLVRDPGRGVEQRERAPHMACDGRGGARNARMNVRTRTQVRM
ncbi:hypothetical protein BW12_10550 [Bifidobacterium sp. UTCIF-3]|nr:hypothetical protein BW09_08755 [Bifidobacterium sp. UTCIF-1]TPF79865.1 hypothetical protein BW08_07475 [Bifidobacterium sp. UTCIF-24]TPF81339.1 hypothetical protein BW12_10550 [Bifidobacterium sp. UTCIF-3]TPF84430.1 hypothetical protein BW07_05015 [Bifidobacterium sp. UTCIF-36]TPF87909.1 hypothetical protein BW10_10820 [Bifidobacterium sp. UTBIF-56]